MLTAQEALDRLREGNQRFVASLKGNQPLPAKHFELAQSQEPIAIILGCSDSRVPAEIVFDQGLGDLFVIRVAGNVVAPSQVGTPRAELPAALLCPTTRQRRSGQGAHRRPSARQRGLRGGASSAPSSSPGPAARRPARQPP